VAREAFILGPSLTGVLSRMERDGLIQRQRDPEDARRTVVQATDKGLRLVETLSLTIEAHYQWMEQTLGKDKLAAALPAAGHPDRTGATMSLAPPPGNPPAPCTARC
jgi:DNA-binding MarR family transcriptional regulator